MKLLKGLACSPVPFWIGRLRRIHRFHVQTIVSQDQLGNGPRPLGVAGLDSVIRACTYTCMATKTISIDLEAYDRLQRARQTPNESFSKVIKRARWDQRNHRCLDVLQRLEALEPLDSDALDALADAQKADRPPDSRWRD